MRDPKRIDSMLHRLLVLWHTQPDMRLCQLVCNLAYRTQRELRHDIFHVEDDALSEQIDRALKEWRA